jgi:hypothetical protein
MSFYFTEKHPESIAVLDISETIKEDFAKAKPSGRLLPMIIDVDRQEQIEDIQTVVRFKKSLKIKSYERDILPVFTTFIPSKISNVMEAPNLHYSTPPEKRAAKFKEIQQTEVYKFFLEEHRPEELSLLHYEIEEILNEGIQLEEFLTTGFMDENIEYNDYRKIATLCFVETLMDFADDIGKRTRDLLKNPDFTEVYHNTLQQIINYLHGVYTEFPREAVRCLFLLTDGDLDHHREGITATHLMMDSFGFCTSEEQKEEVERLINECKL